MTPSINSWNKATYSHLSGSHLTGCDIFYEDLDSLYEFEELKQVVQLLKNFEDLACPNGYRRIVISDLPLKQCTQCPGQDSVVPNSRYQTYFEHLDAEEFEINDEMVDFSRVLRADGLEGLRHDGDVEKSSTEEKQTTVGSPRRHKKESISSTSTVSASSISNLATGLSFASISSTVSESSSPSSTFTSNTSHIASASSTSQAISSPSSASGVVDLTYSSNSLTPASANSSSTPPPRNTASSASSEISTFSLAPSSTISTATSENNSTLTSASSTLTSSKTSVGSAVTNTNQKPPPPTPPLNSTGVNKMGESNEGILESPVPSQAGNSDILKIFQIRKPYLEMNKKPFGIPLLITASKINLTPNEPMEIFVRRCVPVVPCYCPCY
ncbi:hypothetical protein M8J76_016546 [Diaphorina citri]|nr:hypothetical protein M8J75_012305 [Diaphorina citri]KAI5714412.1 hypothetical protein M8J76_016546 [Diaphorina citri]